MVESAAKIDRKSAVPIAAAVLGISLLLVLSVADVLLGTQINTSIVYPSLLLVCWWIRDRRFLWIYTALLIAATIGAAICEGADTRGWVHRSMTIPAILATAAIFHILLRSWQIGDATRQELNSAIDDVVVREEEIV